MPDALTAVCLGVADLGRSIRFYRDGLGWSTVSPPGAPIAFFDFAGTRLALLPAERLADYLGLPAPPPQAAGAAYISLHLASPAEVVALLARAESAGATLLRPLAPTFWGGHYATFSDPDGHVWEVACGGGGAV